MTQPQSDSVTSGQKKPKLGFLLPTRGLLLAEERPQSADRIIDLACRAEEAGLDSVWVGDSLTAKPRLEPLTALAAVAARTNRVRLGTSVLLMALRHPVLLAQTLGTVDLISRGRLMIATGVGGAFNAEQEGEWKAAGVSARRRASRTEEMVQIIKALGRGETVDFSGRHFELDSVTVKPWPVQQGGVPIYLACHWGARARDAQIKRAARLADGVISISDSPEEHTMVIDAVKEEAAALGRDPNSLETVMYLTVNMDTDLARAEAESERYLLGYYGAEIWGDRWGPFGGPERVKERISQYLEAGADTVIVRFASFEPEQQLSTFLEQVAPEFM
ncbi:MAG: LLM class flavin-dependent oxidoreductase [Chloroflexota bacterium]|nr:LLM class flavin-dependent oxidoreductase [Chloroflexota bacterium]